MKLSVFWEEIEIIVIALLIVIPIRMFIVQPFIVHGSSMEPTFYTNDYLIIDELSYRLRAPKRYEVIVFRAPTYDHQYFIKRIIGLPGETVEIKDGDVFVGKNGHLHKLSETFLPSGRQTGGNIKITLDAHHYYVLGDNRSVSYDSRNWGPLEDKKIIGRVWLRLWPPKRIKVFSY